MKKISGILIVIILITLLLFSVGCQQEIPTIKATQLTENEKELLRLTGAERYFIFDVDLSRISSKRLEYHVDYYKKGEFVEHLIHGAISGLSSDEKKQRFVWSQVKTGNNQDEVWTLAFANARMTQKVTIPEQIRAMSWSQNELIPQFI